ncbi:MAG: dsRNA-specific ribonuclease [Methanomassiliicoccales archaeon]|nr:MAG: dsRNA-specific ribonuclease [Methanomassiliicoccales archaeon]
MDPESKIEYITITDGDVLVITQPKGWRKDYVHGNTVAFGGSYMVSGNDESVSKDLKKLQNKLGYTFSSERLLTRALTRKAYAKEQKDQKMVCEDQDAYRVLGDAVLGAIIVDKLRREGLDTGKRITETRQDYEKRTTLAEMAYGLEVPRCIYMTSGEKKQDADLEPKVLAETLEALIGAIFVDKERSLRETEKVVLDWFPERLSE